MKGGQARVGPSVTYGYKQKLPVFRDQRPAALALTGHAS